LPNSPSASVASCDPFPIKWLRISANDKDGFVAMATTDGTDLLDGFFPFSSCLDAFVLLMVRSG